MNFVVAPIHEKAESAQHVKVKFTHIHSSKTKSDKQRQTEEPKRGEATTRGPQAAGNYISPRCSNNAVESSGNTNEMAYRSLVTNPLRIQTRERERELCICDERHER